MFKIDPAKVHATAWIVLACWAGWAMLSNWPHSPTSDDYGRAAQVFQSVVGKAPGPGNLLSASGYPLYYQQFQLAADGKHRLLFFYPFYLLVNVAACAIGTILAGFAVQNLAKFSMRVLLVAVACCALWLIAPYWLVFVDRAADAIGLKFISTVLQYLLILSMQWMFFLPSLVSLALIGKQWLTHRARKPATASQPTCEAT